ncbi:MAG TPA: hypothetical protein PLU43_05365, partial [Lachnospiraceae bacterium]|nr:hypothetical protein [Lachnospiraceae bacterium]
MNDHKYKTKNLYFSPRLLDKLEDIWNHPLTVVEAPMGYGKTTAVKEYLKKTNAPVLWLRIYRDSAEA